MNLLTRLAAIALLASPVSATALADPGPNGTWIMGNGKVTVAVGDCGLNLCGKIVALAKPLDRNGKPKVDKQNPDPALRKRPVIGLTILQNMKADGTNKWVGTIYNADDGYTYKSVMKLSGDLMKVKGCIAFICKSMYFKRAN
ncbi:MAG: DUF2147 domain-containing protein [Hyphomicrobiales bacterium]